MPQPLTPYRHSGEFSPIGALKALTFGLVGAAVIGGVYAYGVRWVPFIYAVALFAVGAGIGSGAVVVLGARLGRVRSGIVVATTALICGVFADYVAWLVWLHAQFDVWYVRPTFMLNAIKAVTELRTLTIKESLVIHGTGLKLLYAAELVLIAGLAAFYARSTLGDKPFCEHCRAWCTATTVLPALEGVADTKALKAQIEAGDLAALTALAPAAADAPARVEITLTRCTGCDEMHLMTVKQVAFEGKKRERREYPVVRHLLLTREAREQLTSGFSARSAPGA